MSQCRLYDYVRLQWHHKEARRRCASSGQKSRSKQVHTRNWYLSNVSECSTSVVLSLAVKRNSHISLPSLNGRNLPKPNCAVQKMVRSLKLKMRVYQLWCTQYTWILVLHIIVDAYVSLFKALLASYMGLHITALLTCIGYYAPILGYMRDRMLWPHSAIQQRICYRVA